MAEFISWPENMNTMPRGITCSPRFKTTAALSHAPWWFRVPCPSHRHPAVATVLVYVCTEPRKVHASSDIVRYWDRFTDVQSSFGRVHNADLFLPKEHTQNAYRLRNCLLHSTASQRRHLMSMLNLFFYCSELTARFLRAVGFAVHAESRRCQLTAALTAMF